MEKKWAVQKPEGVLLRVRVKPKSGKDGIESAQDELVVKISAPPAENQANRALIDFISKKLGMPKSDIHLRKGAKSRNKTLLVEGARKKEIEKLLSTP